MLVLILQSIIKLPRSVNDRLLCLYFTFRLSVQGLKGNLGNLKDKIQDARQKSMSPCSIKSDSVETSIQCNLLENKVSICFATLTRNLSWSPLD